MIIPEVRHAAAPPAGIPRSSISSLTEKLVVDLRQNINLIGCAHPFSIHSVATGNAHFPPAEYAKEGRSHTGTNPIPLDIINDFEEFDKVTKKIRSEVSLNLFFTTYYAAPSLLSNYQNFLLSKHQELLAIFNELKVSLDLDTRSGNLRLKSIYLFGQQKPQGNIAAIHAQEIQQMTIIPKIIREQALRSFFDKLTPQLFRGRPEEIPTIDRPPIRQIIRRGTTRPMATPIPLPTGAQRELTQSDVIEYVARIKRLKPIITNIFICLNRYTDALEIVKKQRRPGEEDLPIFPNPDDLTMCIINLIAITAAICGIIQECRILKNEELAPPPELPEFSRRAAPVTTISGTERALEIAFAYINRILLTNPSPSRIKHADIELIFMRTTSIFGL